MQACYARINVPAITALLSGQYAPQPAIFQRGRVLRNQSGDAQFFPYLTYHLVSDVDWSTKDGLGGEASVQIDVWSRSGSAMEPSLIARQVMMATVRQDWNIPGFITCERESVALLDDPDGLTKHAMIRVRLLYLE